MKNFTQYIKEHHSGLAFWIFSIVAVGLLIGSFFCPPIGTISPSVLEAGAELFAFAALGVIPSAIKEGRSIKLSKGDASIEVSGKDEKENEGD